MRRMRRITRLTCGSRHLHAVIRHYSVMGLAQEEYPFSVCRVRAIVDGGPRPFRGVQEDYDGQDYLPQVTTIVRQYLFSFLWCN